MKSLRVKNINQLSAVLLNSREWALSETELFRADEVPSQIDLLKEQRGITLAQILIGSNKWQAKDVHLDFSDSFVHYVCTGFLRNHI